MTTIKARSLAATIAVLGAIGSPSILHAQMGVGTWVRQATASGSSLTMKVEACCGSGRRLTYHIGSNATAMVLTLESRFDGSSAPVLINGKPSGETMEITRVDAHHTSTILKMNGKTFGTSKATLSADGKTLTVINDLTSSAGGQKLGKSTEIWVRQ
jgi:hypothetical protein